MCFMLSGVSSHSSAPLVIPFFSSCSFSRDRLSCVAYLFSPVSPLCSSHVACRICLGQACRSICCLVPWSPCILTPIPRIRIHISAPPSTPSTLHPDHGRLHPLPSALQIYVLYTKTHTYLACKYTICTSPQTGDFYYTYASL